jgi:hypothetical protein
MTVGFQNLNSSSDLFQKHSFPLTGRQSRGEIEFKILEKPTFEQEGKYPILPFVNVTLTSTFLERLQKIGNAYASGD